MFHRRQFLDFYNSGNYTKSEQLLTVNKPIVQVKTSQHYLAMENMESMD